MANDLIKVNTKYYRNNAKSIILSGKGVGEGFIAEVIYNLDLNDKEVPK